ncbi:hypothetical protein AB0K35_27860 [Micromonospora sp. NPDC053740]|uniref:hypothetical protein n=1 Tax=Micromonospora sp. NPDC053740 TaxID=3155173 RepID=UPI0034442633
MDLFAESFDDLNEVLARQPFDTMSTAERLQVVQIRALAGGVQVVGAGVQPQVPGEAFPRVRGHQSACGVQPLGGGVVGNLHRLVQASVQRHRVAGVRHVLADHLPQVGIHDQHPRAVLDGADERVVDVGKSLRVGLLSHRRSPP